ncbi:MAG: aldehyde dehydrogenase family protein, partial [Nocardioidaceae bacterium]
MTQVSSRNPRTGQVEDRVGEETSPRELEQVCSLAAAAGADIRYTDRAVRAALLRTMARELDSGRDEIIATADRETALGVGRLAGELTRTCYQLGLFADLLDEGSYLEATVDHAGDTPMGPRPDLRRMLVPVGPVAVFGASNFPLAFSVPGGDTAAAVAAGCPVIVKAHPSHPATSMMCHQLLSRAVARGGLARGVIQLVYGQDVGTALVAHQSVQAAAFTGSHSGAR